MLAPMPSCLCPPFSPPLQSSQLGSQPGAGLQREAHPAPSHQGRACKGEILPRLQITREMIAKTTSGRGAFGVGNGARMRPQHCLLRSFSSPHSPPPVLNLYPAAHPFWCQSKVSLRNPRRVSAPWGYPRHLGFLQSLQLSVQTGCGFKAPGDPSPAQNLPPGCWGSRVGLVGLGSSCLGHPSTTTLTC